MQAFASNWTRPYAMGNPGRPYAVADFELLTTILSALMWRKENGSIRMITDSVGERFYRSLGLAPLWDGGISNELDEIPYTVDPSTFWAAGKLYALSHVSAPCVMIDTDFIVWNCLQPQLQGSALTVIHRETLTPEIYPSPDHFTLSSEYQFPLDWNWSAPACNTALAYFGNETIRRTYLQHAFDFIHAVRGRDKLIYMVFAEQRLLAMCAEASGIPIDSLSTQDALFSRDQQDFTHVWGFKQALAEHPQLRETFCRQCASRIRHDFPEYRDVYAHIPSLRKYF
ncbi:MAG: hypothetical protein Q4D42_10300 [Eubacteriales bacterium]|nr:hypothetical protein [Eubacteriales bacterium]